MLTSNKCVWHLAAGNSSFHLQSYIWFTISPSLFAFSRSSTHTYCKPTEAASQDRFGSVYGTTKIVPLLRPSTVCSWVYIFSIIATVIIASIMSACVYVRNCIVTDRAGYLSDKLNFFKTFHSGGSKTSCNWMNWQFHKAVVQIKAVRTSFYTNSSQGEQSR
jgi:hypothetical protein